MFLSWCAHTISFNLAIVHAYVVCDGNWNSYIVLLVTSLHANNFIVCATLYSYSSQHVDILWA